MRVCAHGGRQLVLPLLSPALTKMELHLLALGPHRDSSTRNGVSLSAVPERNLYQPAGLRSSVRIGCEMR